MREGRRGSRKVEIRKKGGREGVGGEDERKGGRDRDFDHFTGWGGKGRRGDGLK